MSPALHADGRVHLTIHLEPLAVDGVAQDALVPRSWQHLLREEIVPLAQTSDAVVLPRPVIELQQRRRAPLDDAADETQGEGIGEPLDGRPEELRDASRHLAKREPLAARGLP